MTITTGSVVAFDGVKGRDGGGEGGGEGGGKGGGEGGGEGGVEGYGVAGGKVVGTCSDMQSNGIPATMQAATNTTHIARGLYLNCLDGASRMGRCGIASPEPPSEQIVRARGFCRNAPPASLYAMAAATIPSSTSVAPPTAIPLTTDSGV